MIFKIFVLVVAAYTVPGQPGRISEEQHYSVVGPNAGYTTKAACRDAMRLDPSIRGAIASHMHDLEDMIAHSSQPGDLANERLVAKCLADKNDL